MFDKKLQLCQLEALFIGHIASDKALKIHPDKVQAIVEMLELEDVQAIQCFIGMVTYVAKFVLRLMEMLEPLRVGSSGQ